MPVSTTKPTTSDDMDIETYYTVVAYVLAGVFGLCVGSFLNVVIYRVPLGMNIANPPSHCPKCDMQIKWYDNIPILSYILLGGKCRNCKTHISFRYTAVEAANAILWLLCVWRFWDQSKIYAVISALTCSVLICVFFIDLEHMLILDRFQIMLAAAGVAVTVVQYDRWMTHLIGGVAGFAVFYAMALIGEKIAGRDAMGGGDIKLSAVMGLYLGWEKLLLAVLLASLSASIMLLILKTVRKDENKEYPFAPFLTSGFALSMLFGDSLISWYMALLT